MKRKLLAVLISLILIIGSVYPVFTVADARVWNGSSTVPPIVNGVYQISTAEELAWFSYAVNVGNSSLNAVLTADIELNTKGSTANAWDPIGDAGHPFKGTFDGQGFTVSGLYINLPDEDYVGFFGHAAKPDETGSGETVDVSPEFIVRNQEIRIKNINITDAVVYGHQNVGGIIGYADSVGVSDCTFSGDVTGSFNSVGGIIGWAYDETVITECSAHGSVTGKQRTGAIAGFASANSVLTKSYSDMTVKGSQNVGGVAGTVSGSNLVGCFFLGSVEGKNKIGGVVGYSAFGLVRGAYSIARLTGTGENIGGAVGSDYGGKYSSLFYSFETSGYEGPAGVGRTLAEMKTSEFVKELNKDWIYFCYDYKEINEGYPVLIWMLETDVWTGELEIPKTNSAGTYLIYKPAELAWFSALVNGKLTDMDANPAANATVMDNLLFSINVHDESMGRIPWTPIGTSAHPYTGIFNGGNYNIAGIYTDNTSGEAGKYVGLFGYVGNADIINTVVLDGLIQGIENVGGIAGYVIGGTISGCVCDSEVGGDKAVGGIVGNLVSSSSQINTSCMTGTVTGTDYTGDKAYLQNVGGIVGYNNRAEIKKCFAYADINAPQARYTGGLVGNNSGGTVTESYSTSTVSGSVTVGGLAGNNNNGTVRNCYSVGKVSGASLAGMAFGNTSGANVSNCCFDMTYQTLSNTLIGATGKTSDEMTGTDALSNLGLSGADWVSAADDVYFYYYPQLSLMKNSSSQAIKTASVESVKRVQNKFVARVEIDGRTDTYYETLDAALQYASVTPSMVLPYVFVIRDTALNAPITVNSKIGLFGENGASLSRREGYTGILIDVTGSLTIGSAAYGYDDAPAFYVDGNEVLGKESGIVVRSGATLNIEDGVSIRNFKTEVNKTSPVRGAAIKIISGNMNVTAGILENNISRTVGGSIYNSGGNVEIRGGLFRNCEATQGAVLFNDGGTVKVTEGRFTENIASMNGGAISTNDVYGVTTISGICEFTGNQATYGGALGAGNYSTLEINGGIFKNNLAYSSGGAVSVETGAEAIMTGGTIADNISDKKQGGAVYNNSVFTMKGRAQIDQSNDIYLETDKYINIPDRLTCTGYAAIITPKYYEERTKVLTGDAMIAHFHKFGVSNNNWYTLSNGEITCMATTTVAVLSKIGAYSVEYIKLKDAFDAVQPGETAIITVVADNTVNEVIKVNGDITLTCDDTSCKTVRGGAFHGVMFDVAKGAVLRMGDAVENPNQTSQKDYKAGTEKQGQLIIDGGYKLTEVVGAAVVNVQQGGSFELNEDAIIRNSVNSTTGTITVSGKMSMLGGTVKDNKSCYGGAVYVMPSGELTLSGGVIAGNTSENGGDAVYSLGTVSRNRHKYDYYYIETVYDENGDAAGTLDPVYYSSSDTDITIAEGEAIYLSSNVINTNKESSVIHITSKDNVPSTPDFKYSSITIDPAEYRIGAVAVKGELLSQNYSSFIPKIRGYHVLADGTLGLNKIVPKASSGMKLNGEKALISGNAIVTKNVSALAGMFENSRNSLRFRNADGTMIRNINYATTDCYIELIGDAGKVIDTVKIVVYGDVNGDGKIDGADSVLIYSVAAGMLNSTNATAAQLEAADANADSAVTAIDADHTNACGLFLQTIDQSGRA